MMPRNSDYTTGWIDTTIHDFLLEIDEPSPSMAYALVTCLDSCFDVADIFKRNPGLNGKAVGKGVLLKTRHLLAVEKRDRLFFGFDEIWFFPLRNVTTKPKGTVITGPSQIAHLVSKPWVPWMSKNNCSLGLGDGVGMNFCARLQGIAKHLVESYVETTANGVHRSRAIA